MDIHEISKYQRDAYDIEELIESTFDDQSIEFKQFVKEIIYVVENTQRYHAIEPSKKSFKALTTIDHYNQVATALYSIFASDPEVLAVIDECHRDSVHYVWSNTNKVAAAIYQECLLAEDISDLKSRLRKLDSEQHSICWPI